LFTGFVRHNIFLTRSLGACGYRSVTRTQMGLV